MKFIPFVLWLLFSMLAPSCATSPRIMKNCKPYIWPNGGGKDTYECEEYVPRQRNKAELAK